MMNITLEGQMSTTIIKQSNYNEVTVGMQKTLSSLKRSIHEFELLAQESNQLFDVYSFLSNYLGYTETTIRHWFSRHTKLGAEDLAKVCMALGDLRPVETYLLEIKEYMKLTKTNFTTLTRN